MILSSSFESYQLLKQKVRVLSRFVDVVGGRGREVDGAVDDDKKGERVRTKPFRTTLFLWETLSYWNSIREILFL